MFQVHTHSTATDAIFYSLHIDHIAKETNFFLQRNVTTREGQDSIVTRLRAGQPRNYGKVLGRRNKFFSPPKGPDWLWDPQSILANGERGVFF
jgi:hypothetical protein